jgi:hypothetical protein
MIVMKCPRILALVMGCYFKLNSLSFLFVFVPDLSLTSLNSCINSKAFSVVSHFVLVLYAIALMDNSFSFFKIEFMFLMRSRT